MEWKDIDWQVLRDLRDRFLQQAKGDYWKTRRELEHYDLAFGARIEAKWKAVAREIGSRMVEEGPLHLVDWGCGTGTASRVLIDQLGDQVSKVSVWDRSALAKTFAVERIRELGVDAEALGSVDAIKGPHWIVASHVWNELEGAHQKAFLKALSVSDGFIWVEPGTPALAGAIVEARAMLRNTFEILAPCPHQSACGMLAPENADHWCHHFAEPEQKFFRTAEWAQFSREMQIDLRSLPTSFLVASKRRSEAGESKARIIGRPRVSKITQLLVCDAQGVSQQTVRPAKAQKKEFQETVFTRWLEK